MTTMHSRQLERRNGGMLPGRETHLVVEAGTGRIDQEHLDVGVLLLQIARHARDRSPSPCWSVIDSTVSHHNGLQCTRRTFHEPDDMTKASSLPSVCCQISGPVVA